MLMGVRRRLVRLHFADSSPSMDGIYVGKEAGHYVLMKAAILSEDGEDPVGLEGETWVPKERVLFMQVLS